MNDLSLNIFEIDISSDSDEEVFTPSPIHRRRPSQAISYILYRNPIIFDHIRTKRYFTYLMFLLYTTFFFSGAIVLKRSIDAINPNTHILFLKFVSSWPDCNDLRPQLWRFFTFGMVHGDFYHYLFNMLSFFTVSNYLEKYYHHCVLFCFLIFVNLSSGFFMYFSSPYVVLIGCSDLIFALFGSLYSHVILNYHVMERLEFSINMVLPAFILIYDLFMYYITDTNVAHFAHWNGMINGFLIGLILYKRIIPTYKNNIRRVSGLFYITLNFLYIINYFNWPPKYGNKLDHHEETCCEQWYKRLQENSNYEKEDICQI